MKCNEDHFHNLNFYDSSFVKYLVCFLLCFINRLSPVSETRLLSVYPCNKLPVVLLFQLVGGHVGGDSVVDDHVVQGHVLPGHQLDHLVGRHPAEEGRH